MNIKEQHIEISLSSQNIASNTRRKLLPGEIDWLLNKMQGRFIASRLKPRKDGSFEVDELEADSIRTLLATSTRSAYLSSADDYEYTASLPGDYSFLLGVDSRVHSNCTEPVSTSDTTETVLSIPLTRSANTTGPYYVTCTLAVSTKTVTLATIAAQAETPYTGLSSKTEIYLFRDSLLWYAWNVWGIEAYWESYLGIYKPGCILFPQASTGSLTIDGGQVVNGTTITLDHTGYSATGSWVSNRLVKNTELSALQQTPFYKASLHSPLAALNAGKLKTYGAVSYTVSQVRVDYIKKPRRMSLPLGQSCELPEEFHQALCDLVVEYFKGMTADPNWEVKLKDNMLRSPTIT